MNGNWTEEAQEMMKSWTEAQTKLWQGWSQATSKFSPSGASAAPDWFGQWQELARRNLAAWTSQEGGIPKQVAERVVAGEEVYLRFVEACLGAFKKAAPGIDAGENWADLLRRYIGQLKEDMTRSPSQWLSPEAAAAMSRDVPELWKLYTAEVQKMVMPWVASLKETHGHLGDAMSGDRYAALKTYNVFMDTFQSTLGKFGAAPAIGYTREFQEKLTKAFETWGEVRRAEAAFQTELVNTGFHAMEDMIRTLVEMGENGEKIRGSRQLFDLWVATAEKAFFEIATTESFAEIQGRLVNAAMHYRIRERELAEEWLKSLHLPTRHELDDAYKHMYQMRREVKALRKELDELRRERKVAEVAPTASQGGRRAKRGTHEAAATGASVPPAAFQP